MRKDRGFTPCEGEQREGGAACCVGTGHFARARSQRRRPCIMRSSCQASREGEVASAKIDSPERQCRQRHGKARPPIPRSFLRGVIFRGGPARNRLVFINSRRERGKKGLPSESCGADDLALCLQLFTAAKCEGREAPSEGLPLMKTSRFLASLPSISATEVRGNSACAGERTCRAEQRRAGRNARSTGRSRLRVRVGPCKRRG